MNSNITLKEHIYQLQKTNNKIIMIYGNDNKFILKLLLSMASIFFFIFYNK